MDPAFNSSFYLFSIYLILSHCMLISRANLQYYYSDTVSPLAQIQHLDAVQRPNLVEVGLLRGDAMHPALRPGQDV